MSKKVANKLLKLTTKFMLGIQKRKELEDLEKFQNEIIKEIQDNIPGMFELMVEQRIKDVESEISNCGNNVMREYNLGKQLSNLFELKDKIWSGYYNASH
jgi:hypothetical protein